MVAGSARNSWPRQAKRGDADEFEEQCGSETISGFSKEQKGRSNHSQFWIRITLEKRSLIRFRHSRAGGNPVD
jgi:hypothetical protein